MPGPLRPASRATSLAPVRLVLAVLAALLVAVLLARPTLADSPFSFDDDDDDDAGWDAEGPPRPASGGSSPRPAAASAHTTKQLLWGSYRPQNYFGLRPRLPESVFMGLAWSDASSYTGLGQLRHATNDQQEVRYAWTRHDGRTFGEERIIDPATNVGFNVSFVKQLHDADDISGGGSWAVRVKGKALDPTRAAQVSFFSYYGSESPDNVIDLNPDAAQAPAGGFGRDQPIQLSGNSPELGQFGIRIVHPSKSDLHEDNVVLNKGVTGPDAKLLSTKVEETAYFAAPMPHGETWRAATVLQNGVAMSMQAALEAAVPTLGQQPREEQARSMIQWDVSGLPHPGVVGRLPNILAPGEPTLAALQSTYELNPSKARGSDSTYESTESQHIFAFDIFFDAPSLTGQKLTSAELTRALEDARSSFDHSFALALPIHHISDSDSYQAKAVNEAFARELISSVLGGVGYFHGTAVVDRSLSLSESDSGDDAAAEGDGQPIDLDAVENLRAERKSEAAEEEDEPPVHREGPFSLTTGTPGRNFFPRGFYWDEGFHLPAISVLDPELGLEILHDWFSAADEDGWIPREMALGTESESRVPAEFLRQDPAHANPPTPILALRLVIDRLGLGLDSSLVGAANESEGFVPNAAWQDSSQVTFGSGNLSADGQADMRRAALERLAEFYPTLKRHYGWFCRSQFGLASAGGRTPSSDYPTSGSGKPGQCAAAFRWRGRSRAGHVFASGLDDYPRASVPHTGELHVDLHAWMGAFARNMAYVANVLARHNVAITGESLLEDAQAFTTDFQRLQTNLDGTLCPNLCLPPAVF